MSLFTHTVYKCWLQSLTPQSRSRATAGFLLGWVFWCSVSYAYRSQFFQLLGHICWNFIRRTSARTQTADVEARASANLEKYSRREEGRLAGIQNISNEAALVFTLNLCFVFASFAEFCSILAYDPGGADTACGTSRTHWNESVGLMRSYAAFTVAWANMAAQAARLIGLAVLVLHLKQRSTTNVEFYCLCTALVIALCMFSMRLHVACSDMSQRLYWLSTPLTQGTWCSFRRWGSPCVSRFSGCLCLRLAIRRS